MTSNGAMQNLFERVKSGLCTLNSAAYRDTSPAVAPAIMTCCLVP